MSHNIDMTTGEAAVMVTGTPAWFRLGTVVDQCQTGDDTEVIARLNWEVEQVPIYIVWNGQRVELDRVANVRKDKGIVLGIVGKGYKVFQNHEMFKFGDAILREKLAGFETAGAIDKGRKIWTTMQIPAKFTVGSNDVVRPNILLANSHDGSLAFTAKLTIVRVVCQNTLNLALRANTKEIKIYHSDSLDTRVAEAREVLGVFHKRLESFQGELDSLGGYKLDEEEVKSYFKKVFPPPKNKERKKQDKQEEQNLLNNSAILENILDKQGAKADVVQDLIVANQVREQVEEAETTKQYEKLFDKLMDGWEAKMNNTKGAEHSLWTAVNAVTRYCDYDKVYRGSGDTEAERENSRLNSQVDSIFFGQSNQIKMNAYNLALNMASKG